MRPYLLRSFGLHAALGAALAFFSARATLPKSNPVYSIDFVGPSGGIISSLSGPAGRAAPAAPARPAPQQTPDEFGSRRRKPGAPLPRPSLLRGFTEKPAEPAPAAAAAAPSAPAGAAGGSGGEAGVSTDLPNFPYPWYISQVRAALWSRWSERLPSEAGQAVVVFTIMPTGAVVDVRTEESSGDPAFDLVALSAVQESAPFPPLPRGFSEPFLKVHVTLKSQ